MDDHELLWVLYAKQFIPFLFNTYVLFVLLLLDIPQGSGSSKMQVEHVVWSLVLSLLLAVLALYCLQSFCCFQEIAYSRLVLQSSNT